MTTGSVYKLRTTDPEDAVLEINRLFELISTRLDRMEGFRGRPHLYDKLLTGSDIIINEGLQGIVLLDRQWPPHYWRLTIVGGVLTPIDLGTTYE